MRFITPAMFLLRRIELTARNIPRRFFIVQVDKISFVHTDKKEANLYTDVLRGVLTETSENIGPTRDQLLKAIKTLAEELERAPYHCCTGRCAGSNYLTGKRRQKVLDSIEEILTLKIS